MCDTLVLNFCDYVNVKKFYIPEFEFTGNLKSRQRQEPDLIRKKHDHSTN